MKTHKFFIQISDSLGDLKNYMYKEARQRLHCKIAHELVTVPKYSETARLMTS